MTLNLPPLAVTIGLLVASNVFMTFAWYAHLRDLSHKPWIIAALCLLGAVFFIFGPHLQAVWQT